MTNKATKPNIISRPPVVVVMGHIDHGKSTLLDYVRKTNVVGGEVGGITQHIAAYEVIHKDEKGKDRKITFLDTPGHEAFSKIRERGAEVADIAILVVSAEDSVKAQTLEALNVIKNSSLPYIVAINKIDKEGANPEKTKMDLAEKEVYLEGYGGDVPYVEISAKKGTNVGQLLDLILILADLKEYTADPSIDATGFVLESSLDPKRGISATLLIKNGHIKKGSYVVAGNAFAPTRIFENFLGAPITQATFSSPFRVVGWNMVPQVGEQFTVLASKKEAEEKVCLNLEKRVSAPKKNGGGRGETKMIPLIIKADTGGSLEAIEKEAAKLNTEDVAFKFVQSKIGAINESDVMLVSSDTNSLIVGFHVKIDQAAKGEIERAGITAKIFDIIYELKDWLGERLEERRPRKEVEEVVGQAKILRNFSRTKDKQVVGGRVISGKFVQGGIVKIIRRENEIGNGIIVSLEQGRQKTKEVEEGKEFGTMIEAKIEIAPGDVLESFVIVCK